MSRVCCWTECFFIWHSEKSREAHTEHWTVPENTQQSWAHSRRRTRGAMVFLSFISRLTDSGCMHLNVAVDRLVLKLTQTRSARLSDALSVLPTSNMCVIVWTFFARKFCSVCSFDCKARKTSIITYRYNDWIKVMPSFWPVENSLQLFLNEFLKKNLEHQKLWSNYGFTDNSLIIINENRSDFCEFVATLWTKDANFSVPDNLNIKRNF